MTNDLPITVQPSPTDVWVCLASGVWNLTGEAPLYLSPTKRSIIRGMLQAAIETLDELDRGDA